MLFIYITRLASNEIFPTSKKIHREVARAKDLSAPLYTRQTYCWQVINKLYILINLHGADHTYFKVLNYIACTTWNLTLIRP